MSGARFWPSPAQALLLAVCLRREPDEATRAWREWKALVDLDDLDAASFQIMSLVSLRLLELGISDPDSGRIKGLHRYGWTQNQVAFRGKSALLKALQSVKIPTMLLGGAALARTVYPEPAARGLSDTQILVPVEDVPRAILLLGERGWTTRQFDPVETVKHCLGYPLLHADHGEVPLHWRPLPRPSRNGQEAWWRGAQSFAFEQTPTHLPAPADHFLFICAGPLRHSSAAGLQWLADCTLLIRQSGMRMDWLRLVKQAQRFQLTLHTRATLAYLRQNFEDSIPPEVIADSAAAQSTWRIASSTSSPAAPRKSKTISSTSSALPRAVICC